MDYDSAGESFKGIVLQHEGDACVVVSHHCPIALIIADRPAVKGIVSIIFVLSYVLRDPI